MSRTWKRVETTENVVDEVMCDVCRTLFEAGKDDEQIENCIFIVKTYGYGSGHFGDMTTVNIDICEECAHKMFGHMTEAITPYTEPWFYIPPEEVAEEEDLTIDTPDATIIFRR